MTVTACEILKRIEASELFAAGEMATVRAEVTAVGPGSDGDAFLKRLHKQGKITAYQAQALWKDKGDRLAFGNYVIEDELGRGGMGVVLKARHKRMQRHVAIKVLAAKLVKDAGAIARFQREVVAAAQLTHTNIVGAFDADEVNGQHILVMEFVPGRDLASIVKQQGPLTVDQAVDCIRQAARGLEFAHKRGVIHRDIKPANLLLDNSGIVKILDMGLARFSDDAEVGTQAELTGSGTIMGTVDYMSPEQALSTKSADARSDIYSLGITLYFLLTASPAYQGDSLMARMMAHANQPIPHLQQARPEIPASLQAIFQKMVAKKPADRYQTMTEVLADLEHCLKGAPPANLQAVVPATVAESLSQVLSPSAGNGGNTAAVLPSMTAITRSVKTATAPAENTHVSQPSSDTLETLPAFSRRRLKRVLQQPSTRKAQRLITGITATAAVMVIGAVVLLWPTPYGTLRLEINDPEIEVSIRGTELVLKGADPQDIKLKPGQKTLVVQRGDFQFETQQLILKKQETTTVRVELLAGEVRVVAGQKLLGRGTLPSSPVVASTALANAVAPNSARPNAVAPNAVAPSKVAPPMAAALDQPTLETVDLLQWSPNFKSSGVLSLGKGNSVTGGAPWFCKEVDVPDSYIAEFELRRQPEDGNTDIVLIVGGRPCFVRLGRNIANKPEPTGLGLLDGYEPVNSRNPTSRVTATLRENEWNRVVCTVKPDAVQVSLNDESIIDWTGNAERLNGHQNLLNSVKNVGLRLGLVQWNGKLECRRATLRAAAISFRGISPLDGDTGTEIAPDLVATYKPKILPLNFQTTQSVFPKTRRWPLEPTSPDEIRWLHTEFALRLTVRSNAPEDLVIKETEPLPAEPVTIVGIVFRRDGRKVTDEVVRRVAGLQDLEFLELDFEPPGASVTRAGLTPLGKLAHLVRLELSRCGSPEIDYSFLQQLPQLRSLRLSVVSFPGWMDRVKTLHDLQELRLNGMNHDRLQELAVLPHLEQLTLGAIPETSVNYRRRLVQELSRTMPWLQITLNVQELYRLEITEPTGPRPAATK